jgi:putative membrane protein
MSKFHTAICGAAMLFAMGAASAAPVASADAAFVKQASAGGLAEVELGNIGATMGTEASVKSFGQDMVRDHTAANDKLKSIATAKGIAVASAPMDADKKTATRMKSLKGDAFNKAFASKMVADHEKTIRLFETEAKSGKDTDLKAFAQETLPTLKNHLEMAQKLPGAGK